MRPIDRVFGKLDAYGLRECGTDRWRARCPVHGGKSANTLSVGIGDGDAVLLKCWSGCDVEQVVHALGLDIADLFPPREAHASPLKRRRMLTAAQALALLDDELNFAAVLMLNEANGVKSSDADRARLVRAAARVAMLHRESRE